MNATLTATVLPSERPAERPYVGRKGRVLDIFEDARPMRVLLDFGAQPGLPHPSIELPITHLLERKALEAFSWQRQVAQENELLCAQLNKVIRTLRLPLNDVLKQLDEHLSLNSAGAIRSLVRDCKDKLVILPSGEVSLSE